MRGPRQEDMITLGWDTIPIDENQKPASTDSTFSNWDGADFPNENHKPATYEEMSTSRTIVLASKFYIHISM